MQQIIRLPFEAPRYQYDDYKTWSDEWELIDGYPYSLIPSPKQKHQRFISIFIRLIGNMLAEKSSACEMYSGLDWIVNNETVVRPDAMIVCGNFETNWLTFPPALILEIASASTYLKDKNIKYELYELNGVPYYLLVDTEKEKVECYQLINGAYQLKGDPIFRLSTDCEIQIDFEKMWQ